MKKRFFIILSILTSLLFTSCLADYLNNKFDYKVPQYLLYQTDYDTAPASKTFTGEYTLTEEDLPVLNPSVLFKGWYFDKDNLKKAEPGLTIKETTTLYASWDTFSF